MGPGRGRVPQASCHRLLLRIRPPVRALWTLSRANVVFNENGGAAGLAGRKRVVWVREHMTPREAAEPGV